MKKNKDRMTSKGIPLININDIPDMTQINPSFEKIDELLDSNQEIENHKNKSFISEDGVHDLKYDPSTKNFYYKENSLWNKVVLENQKPPVIEIEPILNFRAKDIRNLSDFNSGTVNVSWSGTNTIVTDGIKTNASGYGLFDFDFTNYQELTVSYTFQSHNKSDWSALLNLAYTTSNSTYGFKLEYADNGTISFEGISNASGSVVITNEQYPPRSSVIELNKKYNAIISISEIEPVKIYMNGILIHSINQPEGKKGWNGNNHRNILKNSFCNRLSNNKSNLTVTHHALRIWDVALTEEQVLNEFNKDNQDYQIL